MVQLGIMKWSGHHQLKFFCCEILLFSFGTLGLIAPKWIGRKNAIGNSFTDNSIKVRCQLLDGTQSQMALGTQVKVVLVDKRAIQCRKRNVCQFVLLIQELFDMLVSVLVGSKCACNTIHTYTLFVVLDESTKITHQGLLT